MPEYIYSSNEGKHWFNTVLEVCRKILKRDHSHIFHTIFKKSKRRSRWFPIPVSYYEYENAYRDRGSYNGMNGVDLHPMVFTCLSHRWLSGRITQYFLSQPYYVSFPDFEVTNIAGRFVFWGEETLSLQVFATDFANVRRKFNVDANNPYGFVDIANLGISFLEDDVED